MVLKMANLKDLGLAMCAGLMTSKLSLFSKQTIINKINSLIKLSQHAIVI